ncbi:MULTISPECIES: serine hydrolase domain-containing protein [unclassified Modestobacter]|uniref:serine hydrolase domain-containing protein n=1 Tax=unclassified Modestobacter TaxID=2643866 RepID=UPI0022AAE63E|nr:MULTISPECIES: serine hydrolase domain-containing protein [unclassified Modestobacter]MCZ2810163.1 serine hydrolase [Modestobacter sp. VKM Ac-2979]MCZ2841649.1 serine hydrolase [Modestobacter sp. VKM Ac-2980]MCZ2850246.1 serine hydrolase [Modestobacter sp. VKM Ac-2978]
MSSATHPNRSRRTWATLLVAAATVTAAGATGLLTPDVAEAGGARPAHAFQDELDQLVADDGFPGALAAVRGADGRVRHLTAGVGDLTTGEPVPVDGQVRIASNTKTFVATVVLQLVGEGLVDLDAPIETYLPGLVRGPGGDGNAITVRQLLQHTSGLPDYDDVVVADYLAVQHRYVEPHQLLDIALARPASFAPDTGWEYSNTNYVLAGLLVQEVTGRPIGEQITTRVIEPLDLDDTYWPLEGEQVIRDEHPSGYYAPAPDAEYTDVTVQDPSFGWAAGQMVSSPGDLLEFFTALVDGELLAPELLAEMQTTVPAPESTASGDEPYGLGLQSLSLSCGVTAWTHGGDIPGYETRGAVTEDGRGVMVAVTALPTAVEQIVHVEDAVDAAVCG